MTTEWLLAWWNLIYTAPFCLAVLYLGVYAVSGLTFGDADVDADAEVDIDADIDADAEVDVDADVDADADAEAGADADHDVDQDVDHDADHDAPASSASHSGTMVDPFYLWPLVWIGMGRAPLSVILMVLLMTWGTLGFTVNQVLAPLVPWDWLVLAGSLPLAALGSITITRGVVRLMARWLPTTETSARPVAKLVGTAGEAMFEIDARFGLTAVRDRLGDFYQVPCRVYADQPPIPKGSRVLLVDYDAREKLFFVTPFQLELP